MPLSRPSLLPALALLALASPRAPARAQEGNARAEAIARASAPAKAALAFIASQARRIRDPSLRSAVRELLANPAPTFMARHPDAAARERAYRALVDAGLLDPARVAPDALFPPLPDPSRAPLSFLAAPGDVTSGHHAYPGGLAEHTAFNLQSALDLEANYRRRYGITDLSHDLVVAAPILHDLMKPWCLQFRADGTELEQATIAGTSSHHVFVLAELVHRGLSPELLAAVAAAHEAPHLAEEKVAGYLRAAAILAGADPVQRGLVAPGEAGGGWKLGRPPSLEAAISHLSDHDYVVAGPASRGVAAALDAEIAARGGPELTPAERRWLSFQIQARVPGMAIFAARRARGPSAVRELVRAR